MVNDLKKVPSQPIDNFEGFIDEQEGEDQAQGGNVIRGTRRIKFDNGKWFFADDETEIAADREFVAVGILRVVQKFVNGEPADKIIVEPGKKFPDIAALNVKCPEEEWSEYNGEPRGPWSGQSIVYPLTETPLIRGSPRHGRLNSCGAGTGPTHNGPASTVRCKCLSQGSPQRRTLVQTVPPPPTGLRHRR